MIGRCRYGCPFAHQRDMKAERNYWAGTSAGGSALVGASSAGGWTFSGATSPEVTCSLGASSSSICEEPVPCTEADTRQSTMSEEANVQVLFSRKSAVRCTPPICEAPVKPAARPPPLGFCASTTKASNAATMRMSMEMTTRMDPLDARFERGRKVKPFHTTPEHGVITCPAALPEPLPEL